MNKRTAEKEVFETWTPESLAEAIRDKADEINVLFQIAYRSDLRVDASVKNVSTVGTMRALVVEVYRAL